jgi:hypothetical protein
VGVGLHLRLLWAFVTRGPLLLWLSPRPFRLVAWGARYFLPPPRTAAVGTGSAAE